MSDWRIDNDMNMYLKGLEDGKDRNKQEIEKLQFKIDKARKYIKDNIYKNGNEECYTFDGDIFEVLKILGDKENE